RSDPSVAIQPVDDCRLRARIAQLRDFAGCPGCSRDLVTCRDQPWDEMPTQCPGPSCDEDSHVLSFPIDPFSSDKAPPETVTPVDFSFRAQGCRSRIASA